MSLVISIGQVLSRCYKIRHLNLSGCKGVKLHGLNFEFVKLEVLNLSDTYIDDEALYITLKKCCGLLKLFLQQQLSPEAASLNLPDDCWQSIFTFLVDGDDYNHHYIEPLSLTSKQFLSITNRLRSSFTISDTTLPFIPDLFHRFPNLTSLHFTSFQGDLNAILCQISKFPFKFKSLKLSVQTKFPAKGLRALSKKITTLTSLTCTDIASLSNHDCVLISKCFPLLEELHLHLQHKATYSQSVQIGVEAMLTALPKLRKINLYGAFYIINDDSLLLHLCKNCEFLEEVVMFTSEFLTPDGIASAIRQRPTLTSISFRWSTKSHDIINSHFIDSLVSLKGLTCLHLIHTNISDELLSSAAMGDLPLKSLSLRSCTGYSYAGIFSLLSKCLHIQHLDLQNTDFLNDHHIVTLSSFLADLVSINLNHCRKLTDSALFALVKKCFSLSEIQMKRTRIGENIVENSNSSMNFVLNPRLKSLYLALNYSSLFKDESLLMFASILTNLQLLDLSFCNYISEESICQVLRKCCKIRHLNISGCNVAKLHILNFEVSKLEVLNLSCTRVADEALYAISKNCRGLLKLCLKSCKDVTEKGVKHVVENCTQLREIDLKNCYKVCADIVDIIVHLRPSSLRKIIV